MDKAAEAMEILKQYDQEHVIDLLNKLDQEKRQELLEQINIIKETMNNYGDKWAINIISLKENKSYIIYSNDDVAINISKLFDCICEDDMLIIKPAKLRKEIIGRALGK